MLIHHCNSAEARLTTKKQHNKKAIFALAFGVFFGAIAILLLPGRFLVSIRSTSSVTKNRSNNDSDMEASPSNSNSEQLLVLVPRGGKGENNKLAFTDIVKATNNFDKENIIGCGGYGLVYESELPADGSKLVIKKLNGEMCLMEREFTAEVEALSMAQHENLVPLWGYCIKGNSRLLMYSFTGNGSLDDWLHNREDDARSFLDRPTRLRIAQGASRGLSYILTLFTVASNPTRQGVQAYVADFGLSRLTLPNKTMPQLSLSALQVPPEHGQAWVATLRGDMYSFGIVLLELLMGKRPVPVLSTSKELVPWVQEMKSEREQNEVLDPTLTGLQHESA